MYGPKITWADQTMVTNEQEYEKQQQPSNRNSELSFYLDFKSCTPLKTPSRKPSVLRQLVRDTRERFGKENSTGFNTAMNTGPIRMKFKNKKQQQVISAEDKNNLNNTFSVSSVPLSSTSAVEDIEDSEDRRKTFILPTTSHSNPRKDLSSVSFSLVDDMAEKTFTLTNDLMYPPDTPPSNDFAKNTSIPVRTPLKSTENTRNSNNTERKIPPRMRSFTEMSGLRENRCDRTFAVPRPKKRNLNIGLPTRSVSTLSLNNKENAKPKNKIRTLRPSQSLVSLTNQKSTKNEKARFRF